MNRSYFSRFALPLGVVGLAALLSLSIAATFAQSRRPAAPAEKAPAAQADKATAAPVGKAVAGPAGKADALSVENGRKAFVQHGCFSCHGFSGEGGRGARLVQNPIPLQAFAQYVRRPTRGMPPFGTQVSDQELADMFAYIKSIGPSPDPKSIPLLMNP